MHIQTLKGFQSPAQYNQAKLKGWSVYIKSSEGKKKQENIFFHLSSPINPVLFQAWGFLINMLYVVCGYL